MPEQPQSLYDALRAGATNYDLGEHVTVGGVTYRITHRTEQSMTLRATLPSTYHDAVTRKAPERS